MRTPRALARSLPSPVRDRISSRSNSARPPRIVTSSRPCGVVVKTDRAQLRRVLEALAPGDVLVVTRLDRLKGNANRQSTLRTQGRARVTQALGRVRQAARQGKTERFTALLHHVDVDMLRAAFLALKRRAAAGVDGVTWQDYEVEVELRLGDLHDRVHGGS